MNKAGDQEERRAYHVQAVLGSGGFGAVYRAKYVGEGRFSKIVALKVLHANMAAVDEVAMRMRDEARMLGLISHRNIVQVDRLVQLNGRWTIVMEYVDGVDLKTIAHASPLPVGAALEVASEVASALHQAYNYIPLDDSIPEDERRPLEILHRDIKPANIQITRHGEVKVLDFGIARGNFDTREAKTQELFFGSPEYTAPERYDLEETSAGDVYSLGCVLYEALIGKAYGRTSARPTQHNDLIEARLALLDENVLKGQADDVLELLTAMLAYEGVDRPSAREVERRCARMRIKHGEPLLREWTESALPPLLDERTEQPADDLTGSTLYEQITGSQARPRPGATPRKPPRKKPELASEGKKARRSIREAFEQKVQEEQAPPAAEPPPVELVDASPPPVQPASEARAADPLPAKPKPEEETRPELEPAPKSPTRPTEIPTGVVSADFGQEAATDPDLGQPPAPKQTVVVPEVPTTCVNIESVRPPSPQPKKWEPTPSAQPVPPTQPAHEQPTPERKRPAWVLPVAGIGAVAMLAAIVVGALSHEWAPQVVEPPLVVEQEPEPTTSVPSAGVALDKESETVPVELAKVTAPEAIESDQGSSGQAEAAPSTPATAPVRQSPPPPPQSPPTEEEIVPSGTSMVNVRGQDLGVILKGATGTYDVPGWVPPGTYTITAEFPGYGRTDSGKLNVVAGAEATISCDASFGKCKQL